MRTDRPDHPTRQHDPDDRGTTSIAVIGTTLLGLSTLFVLTIACKVSMTVEYMLALV